MLTVGATVLTLDVLSNTAILSDARVTPLPGGSASFGLWAQLRRCWWNGDGGDMTRSSNGSALWPVCQKHVAARAYGRALSLITNQKAKLSIWENELPAAFIY